MGRSGRLIFDHTRETMENQNLDAMADRWVWWCETRRYFAPPVKQNILARFRPSKQSFEPDAFMDAEMPFLNMAIHAMCEQGPHIKDAECFMGVHWYRMPKKTLAFHFKCERGTVYNRARRFMRNAVALAKTIRQAHECLKVEKCSNEIEQNSALVD
jgi:hypothetical protein